MAELDRPATREAPAVLTDIDGASRMLSYPPRTFRRIKNRPDFPRPVVIGRLVRYRVADIVAWADAQADAANAKR